MILIFSSITEEST